MRHVATFAMHGCNEMSPWRMFTRAELSTLAGLAVGRGGVARLAESARERFL